MEREEFADFYAASFGYFRRADGVQTSFALINMRSYTCTTDPPPGSPLDSVMVGS